MIANIIRWSIDNRALVVLLSIVLCLWGVHAMRTLPIDAIPDLSDVQVIIKAEFPGQTPEVVEDQITYPLTTAMLGVPGATTVRGFSYQGYSFVYVLFKDGTDPYWARSRVLEYINEVSGKLPSGVQPTLGPDASGVSWIYQYALIDRSGQNDLSQLRSLQDWLFRFELQTLPGVSEVAAVGGMVKQYQIVVDPALLRLHSLPLSSVIKALKLGNAEIGASVIEMSEAEYQVRVRGYVSSTKDLLELGPIGVSQAGTSLYIKDVAEVRLGPDDRRGVADFNGEGEAVGGIILMRWDGNARETIQHVKHKLKELEARLPAGVEIVEVYDRSNLIERAVNALKHRLGEEVILVILISTLFLLHIRSALVIALSLPVGILLAFIVMRYLGINANIMSLGGIAIAIGTMVDAAIVMVENVHRQSECKSQRNRIQVITDAAQQVGPPLFISLLIITISFLPVLALEGQEGRLFTPLTLTKTWAMAAAALLSITLVPALMAYFIRGKLQPEKNLRLNRGLQNLYRPIIHVSLQHPRKTLGLFLLIFSSALWPISQMGTQFMPALDEGDLLYMPTTLPGISIGKARELLQQTDRLIKTVAEVESVFGKVGRAESATDPAPLTMIETTIRLKPRNQWREDLTLSDLIQELDDTVQAPGLVNAWLMPISARLNMLSTGVKTPLGIRISGPTLAGTEKIAAQVEVALSVLAGTRSIVAERALQGRYFDIEIDRFRAGQYWMNIKDVQQVLATAVGGITLGESIEGRERYPINIRYPRHLRNSLERLQQLPVISERGEHLSLSDLATVTISDGPTMIKSENGRLSTWIYIDTQNTDLGRYVNKAKAILQAQLDLAPGYTLHWSGQYEYYERANERLTVIVPITLLAVFLMLFILFRRFTEPLLIMATVPFALFGGVWAMYLFNMDFTLASGIGFVALAGITAEFGVVMLVYLNEALQASAQNVTRTKSTQMIIVDAALQRVRPKMMTMAVILAGLLPIILSEETGSEMMRAIALPVFGGMIAAPIVSMILIPVAYFVLNRQPHSQISTINNGS